MSNEEQEGLINLVAELTELYTSRESTSISYEKANMLMEAVLYCIREAKTVKKAGQGNLTNEIQTGSEATDLKEQYQKGYQFVLDKVKGTNALYNQMILHFSSYGNQCYYDTIVKGYPQFFLRYDARFCPQDHLLMLDYPLLKSIEGSGIDLITEYLYCVILEQRFLYPVGEDRVKELMTQYEYGYEEGIINLCSPILRYKVVLELFQIKQQKLTLGNEELQELCRMTEENTSGELLRAFNKALWGMIEQEYSGRKDLYDYLCLDMQDFVIELKNACHYHNERALFPA